MLRERFWGVGVILWTLTLCVTLVTCRKLYEGRAHARMDRDGNVRFVASSVDEYGEESDADVRDKRDVITTWTITDGDKQQFLDTHSMYRRMQGSSNMNYLYWNDTLADYAQEFGDLCLWGHDQPDRSDAAWSNDFIGQNLYFRSVDYDISYAVKRWHDEIADYDYDTRTCTGDICGHYTQLTWAYSSWVGCTKLYCADTLDLYTDVNLGRAYYTLCNYGPGGNVAGMDPFKKGENCTRCDSDMFWCDDGLCRNCPADGIADQCECADGCLHGTTDPTTCRCGTCDDGWTGDTCTDRCENINANCGLVRGWKEKNCDGNNAASLAYYCPVMCGLCVEADIVTTTDSVQTDGMSHSAVATTPVEAVIVTTTDSVQTGGTSHSAGTTTPETAQTTARRSTTLMPVTVAADSQCTGTTCYNGASVVEEPCGCECAAGYQGEQCAQNTEEAVSGVEMKLVAHLEQYTDLEPVILETLASVVNDICRQAEYYGQCCPGSNALSVAAGLTYVAVNDVTTGQGYPVMDSGDLLTLMYITLPENSGFCDDARRRKRSLSGVTLPQSVLYQAIVANQANLSSALLDCCGVEVLDIARGENKTGWVYTDQSGSGKTERLIVAGWVCLALILIVGGTSTVVAIVILKQRSKARSKTEVVVAQDPGQENDRAGSSQVRAQHSATGTGADTLAETPSRQPEMPEMTVVEA